MSEIDWEQYQYTLSIAVEEANTRTNARLAGEVARVSRLTENEIQRLFPEPADAQRVAELMKIVKQSGSRHEQINRLMQNVEQFGGVIFTLLKQLA